VTKSQSAAIVSAIGLLTGSITIFTLLTDPSDQVVTLLVRSFLPLCFSTILVGAGWWMHTQGLSQTVTKRILLWLFVVGSLMMAFEFATILFQQAEGVVLADRIATVHNGFVRGAVIGVAIGLYDGQRMITEQREKQLQRQNDRLDTFASTVSHDLRNPLTVAKGNLELLRMDVKNHDTLFSEIETAHDRAEEIIEDALTLARDGAIITNAEPLELDAVSTAAWDSIDAPNATLSIVEATTIDGDRARILRLFENCLRNAVEHGGAAVSITVGTLPTEDGFYISDSGPGIDPETGEDVFEQGYTTNEEGSGLGLAIVQTIAEAHGWTVRLRESTAGGARFEFVTEGSTEPIEAKAS